MVAFGDLGRLFGLGNTGETAVSLGRAIGITNPLTLNAIGTSAQKAADFVSPTSDVSAPPAGVDSAASLSRVSQTSQLPQSILDRTASGGIMDRRDSSQAFIGGFGVPALIVTGKQKLTQI